MICRSDCQSFQMQCYLERSCGTQWFNTFLQKPCLCLSVLCMLSRIARAQSLVKTFALLSSLSVTPCETWWISLRCSAWTLHLWFRKPLIEAKDSLCWVGGNVDLCGPGNPHKSWLSLLLHYSHPISFSCSPSFIHSICFLDCCIVSTSFSSSLSLIYSLVLLT